MTKVAFQQRILCQNEREAQDLDDAAGTYSMGEALVWALPFFTVLAPSERYNLQHRRRHKKLTDWGRQMIRQLRRWLPLRKLVVVADSTYAALDLLACVAGLIEPVALVTRLRLDAALYDPAPVRKPGTNGRPREVREHVSQPWPNGSSIRRLSGRASPWLGMAGLHVRSNWQAKPRSGITPDCHRSRSVGYSFEIRRGSLTLKRISCTDQQAQAQNILAWFVLRWQLEVTFHEVRAQMARGDAAAMV